MSIFIQNFVGDLERFTDPYVYQITNLETGEKVIGSHNGGEGFKYMTSTGGLHKEIKQNPENFERVIIFQSPDLQAVRDMEVKMIALLDAVNDPLYLNQKNSRYNKGLNPYDRLAKRPANMESTDHTLFYGHTYDYVASVFSYDPETGMIFNSRGRELTATDQKGYIKVCLAYDKGIQHQVYGHRVAWYLHHGELNPNLYMYHVNDNNSDNRIKNLRLRNSIKNHGMPVV